LANDLACLKRWLSKSAQRPRQKISLIRELLELHAERAHLRKISGRVRAEEEFDGEGEEYGVSNLAAKVNKCSGVKLATTYA